MSKICWWGEFQWHYRKQRNIQNDLNFKNFSIDHMGIYTAVLQLPITATSAKWLSRPLEYQYTLVWGIEMLKIFNGNPGSNSANK